jgi:tetratricopeptide (TPR) repeat protein
MTRRFLAACVALLFAMFGLCVGCEQKPAQPCVCEAAPTVDTVLVAYLSKLRAAHHKADLLEQSGKLRDATETLDAAIEAHGDLRSRAEVREVQADTLARLSNLRSQQGEFDAAERSIRMGLGLLSPESSYFQGHLFELRGLNAERRAKALAESGDEQRAQEARREALEAFRRVIEIQDRVIRNEMMDAGDVSSDR